MKSIYVPGFVEEAGDGIRSGKKFYPVCPYCRSESKQHRIPRLRWMHLLPKSRYYECSHCGVRYLAVLGRIHFHLRF